MYEANDGSFAQRTASGYSRPARTAVDFGSYSTAAPPHELPGCAIGDRC